MGRTDEELRELYLQYCEGEKSSERNEESLAPRINHAIAEARLAQAVANYTSYPAIVAVVISVLAIVFNIKTMDGLVYAILLVIIIGISMVGFMYTRSNAVLEKKIIAMALEECKEKKENTANRQI